MIWQCFTVLLFAFLLVENGWMYKVVVERLIQERDTAQATVALFEANHREERRCQDFMLELQRCLRDPSPTACEHLRHKYPGEIGRAHV